MKLNEDALNIAYKAYKSIRGYAREEVIYGRPSDPGFQVLNDLAAGIKAYIAALPLKITEREIQTRPTIEELLVAKYSDLDKQLMEGGTVTIDHLEKNIGNLKENVRLNTQSQPPSDDEIEAVARAICQAAGQGPDEISYGCHLDGIYYEEMIYWQTYETMAKAAIQTIRARDMDKGE